MNASQWLALGLVLFVACTGAEAASKLKVGDIATVKEDKTPVKRGRTVIAYLNKGQSIKVYSIRGSFALVFVKLGGKPTEGDMSVADLEPPARKEVEKVAAIYHVDDEIITVRQAYLMMGKKELGKVKKATRLVVKKVKGDWLGVYATIEGKRTWGWLRTKDVTYAPVRAPGDEKK